MNQLSEVRKGDSLEFFFTPFDSTYDKDGDVNLLGDYTCQITVKATPSGSDLITPRTIAQNDNKTGFYGYLTDTETSSLTAGTRFIVADMDNGTEHKQKLMKFTVIEDWTA